MIKTTELPSKGHDNILFINLITVDINQIANNKKIKVERND